MNQDILRPGDMIRVIDPLLPSYNRCLYIDFISVNKMYCLSTRIGNGLADCYTGRSQITLIKPKTILIK
jgi:hypothetical protein